MKIYHTLLLRAISVIVVAVICLGNAASALSAEQKAIMDANILRFDIEPSTLCAGSSSGVNLPTGTPAQNGKAIFDYLTEPGRLKPHQAAGVIGNMVVESGLQPLRKQGTPSGEETTAQQFKASGSQVGWGLVQFTPGSKFINTQNPINDANNLGSQISFIWNQLEGRTPIPEKTAGDQLKATNTVAEAVLAFQGNSSAGGKYYGYERPADQTGTVSLRTSYALKALAQYGSGAPVSSGTGADVSSTCGTTASKDGWIWPVKGGVYAGPCWNNVVSGLGYHAGMDINSSVANNPAIAAHEGQVVAKGFDTYAGNYVTVKSTDGIYYSYEHLASIAVGGTQQVAAGDDIGIIGKTGRLFISAANKGHLHFVTAERNTLGSYSDGSQVGKTRNPLDFLPPKAPSNYKCSN